jgi:hypothetical protein
MVLPDSHGVSRAPRYSGTGSRRLMYFVNGAITHYGQTFQTVRLYMNFVTSRDIPNWPHNPRPIEMVRVWAVPLSLAATDGITIVFYSWGYLDVSVPPVRLIHLCIQCMILEHDLQWVSPFGNPRFKACLAAPRGLSQLTASFIAFLCLGIHRTPFVA